MTIELRKKLKAKKPKFARQDTHKTKVKERWRRPKGLHSKMRHANAGHRRMVEAGYGSPRGVRGLDPTGLCPVRVATLADLAKVDKERDSIVLAATLGLRKRAAIVTEANTKGLKVLNIKDQQAFPKRVEEDLAARKKEKEAAKKAKEKVEKAKPKKEKKEEVPEETQKEQEKKELDKLLTTKK